VTVTFHILLTGVLIFFARIVDVSVGTVRTIVTVQGRTRLAFVLGFIEVTIWVTIISAIVQQIYTAPILAIFYGLGFATGNVVGIALERKIALGHVALRAFSRTAGPRAAARLRDLESIKSDDPEAFYIVEQAREVSHVQMPAYSVPTGWRAVLKRK
jgi:uncharacterized protein YebE (UPF0316 family)